MAKVIIEPISRSVTPGSTTSFKVRVEGSDALMVRLLPCEEAVDYGVQFERGGLERRIDENELTLTIEVPARASMA